MNVYGSQGGDQKSLHKETNKTNVCFLHSLIIVVVVCVVGVTVIVTAATMVCFCGRQKRKKKGVYVVNP